MVVSLLCLPESAMGLCEKEIRYTNLHCTNLLITL